MADTKKEQKPILKWFQDEIEDADIIELIWEDLICDLTELIKEINPDGYWYCEVENFGWRKSDGHAFLEFDNGRSLISKVLPKTDCSFNVFQEDNIIRIQNFHHDSPCGNEWYTLTPISQNQFENQSY